MSKRAIGKSKLSGLIDSDSEDGRDAMPTPDSTLENMPQLSSRPRGRPKAASGKVTKPKTVQRRLSGRAAKGKRGKRPALIDRTNQQNANDTEEVDEFEGQGDHQMAGDMSQDELEEAAPQQNARRAPGSTTRGRKMQARQGENSKMELDVSEIPATQIFPNSTTKKVSKKKQTAKKVPNEIVEEASKIIHETQASPMDLDVSEEDSFHEPTPRLAAPPKARHRSPVRSRQTSTTRRRPGSASDTERSDPAIRRKLGDITRKFENLDLKYRNLREIGVKEAEHNFEKLSKQSEEKTRG